jgi:hypothetical protein
VIVRAAGVDLAFRRNSSALAVGVGDSDARTVAVERVREWRPRGTPLVPSAVCAEVVAECVEARVTHVVADGHYVEHLREHTRAAGLVLVDAPGPSETWQLTARVAREAGRLRLPEHDRLRLQLEAVRFTYEAQGRVSVQLDTAADGSHGDLAAAVNLCVWRLASVCRVLSDPTHAPSLRVFGGRRERVRV